MNNVTELKAMGHTLDRVTFALSAWEAMNGEALSLSGMSLTFENGFYSLAAGDSTSAAYWYCGAQGGPYGLANVGDAVKPECYVANGNGINLVANRTPNGDPTAVGGWYSGHLQTVNRSGMGFAQRYGYFEATMKLPMYYMAWPAFWLKHRDKWLDVNAVNVEIDVLEHYGLFQPTRLNSTIHHGISANRLWNETYTTTSADLTQAHQYGVLLDRDWITVYFDRLAIARHPMLDDYRQEMYPMLTLSIDGRSEQIAEIANVPSTLTLEVTNLVVYK
jgi:hypothetical protein